MAKATPEGKVKKQLLDFLKTFGDDCFYYMPVQNGMGQSGIPDVMAIIHGVPFAFECKATPKQHPTILQAMALARINKAKGYALVVDNVSVEFLITAIKGWADAEPYNLDTSFVDYLTVQEYSDLLRWKSKLEPMEFESATRS